MRRYNQVINRLEQAWRRSRMRCPPEGLESVLCAVDEGVAPETGSRFFTALVSKLTQCLGTDYALVGTLDPARAGHITTLAVCGGGRMATNFTYDIHGTPCEDVLQRGPCVFADGVQERFPEDLLLQQMGVESYVGTWLVDSSDRPIGVLTVLHGAPMPNPALADAILRIFAPRTSAEFERLRAEEALRTSEEKLAIVFKSSPDAITLSSVADGRFSDVNDGFTWTFGYSREEALGRSALELELWRSPDQRREFVGWLAQHGCVRNMEAELLARNGAIKTCLISADVIEIQGRAWMLAVTRDITDRKKAETTLRESERRYRSLYEQSQALNLAAGRERERREEHLRQAEKMDAVARFAGTVAHDFNNVLQVVQGNLMLALDDLPAAAPAASGVSEALAAVDRAAALTRQLLTFSRRDPVKPVLTDVAGVIADMTTTLAGVIGGHIALSVTCERDLPPVLIDRSQLEQIVFNLCENARNAMPAGGRLDLDVRTVHLSPDAGLPHAGGGSGTFLCLTVSDTGAGIPPELLSRIFEPFLTRKEAGRGAGLGLATVYGIVHRYGGFIDVASGVDHGTTFRIFLPPAANGVAQEEPATS